MISNILQGSTSDPMPLGKAQSKEGTEELFTISQERFDQYVTMGATLTANYKQLLADVVRENIEMDYSGLNKACAKDMYPLPKEGEELASLMGYPYKCFLQLPQKKYKPKYEWRRGGEKTGPEEKMYSYAIWLKFRASNYAMDCEALLAGLAASANQGLATINLEYLNQEVSVGIKTRPSVEETSSSKKGKTTNNALGTKPNCNREASGSN
ncbi:hypothetical protein Tco_1120581 [Tanacetum coccineum]